MDWNASAELENNTLLNNTLYPGFVMYPKELILAYNTFLSVTIAFGVPGNLLVLLVFVKMKVSTSTDWFIFFITLFDFLSSVANVPVYLTFTNGSWAYYGTDFICRLHMYLSQVVVVTSALANCGLAVERYLKVCKPHSVQISRNNARNACFFICIIASIASIPSANMYTNGRGTCTSGRLGLGGFLYFIAVFLLFVITIFVITFCYIKICRAIFRSESRVNAHRSRGIKRGIESSRNRNSGLFHSTRVHPYTETSSTSCNGYGENPDSDALASNSEKEKSIELKGLGLKSPNLLGSNKQTKSSMWTTDASHSLNHLTKETLATRSDSKSAKTRSYTMRASTSKSHTVTTQVVRQSVRTTKIALFVCIIFIVSWVVPLSCFILLQLVATVPVIRFSLFGKMTYLLSTFTNPFVYAWLNIKFRQKLKRFLHCCK